MSDGYFEFWRESVHSVAHLHLSVVVAFAKSLPFVRQRRKTGKRGSTLLRAARDILTRHPQSTAGDVTMNGQYQEEEHGMGVEEHEMVR